MTGNRIKRKQKPIELNRIEINSMEKEPIAKKREKMYLIKPKNQKTIKEKK